MPLVLPGLGAGVEVPALCQPQGLYSRAAVEREFSAGEIVFWGCLFGLFFVWLFFFLVARATQRDSDKLERLRFLVLYVYLMHFVLSCLEINPGLCRKELVQHDFIARTPVACLRLCDVL